MRDTYGPEARRATVECGNLPMAQFEAMFSYDDALTSQTLEANARHLDKPQAVLLEDIGTYLASHPNVEALRRLLRFGGADFIEFSHSLIDLPDRARLAADDLELPKLFLVQLTVGHFCLVCRAKLPALGHVMAGILRVMADDYVALGCLEHRGLHNQTETVDIMLVETSYAKGRSFVLGQRPVKGRAADGK